MRTPRTGARPALAILVLPLGTLLACATPHAQATEVELKPSWKTGTKAVYEVSRCRKEARFLMPADTCIKNSIQIEVLRTGPNGSRQLWKTSTPTENLGGSIAGSAMDPMIEKALNGKLDIEFDESAQPVRLLNAKEVRDTLEAAYQSIAEQASRAGKDTQTIARGRAFMSQLLSTDAQLIALTTKDVSILYAPIGGRYTLDTPLQGRSTMQTPFGGQIEAKVTVTARAGSSPGAGIEVRMDEELDPEAVRRLTGKMIEAASPASGSSAAEVQARAIDLRRTAVYQMQPGSSWPARVRWTQTAKGDGEERTESIEFKRTR